MTGEGLRIDLMEAEQGTFFVSGSASPTPTGEGMIRLLASELARLPNIERLLLANAASAFYVQNEQPKHATREDLLGFLQEAKAKEVRIDSIIEGEKQKAG